MVKLYLKKPDRYSVLKIITIYAIFSGLWIYLSDTALGLFISDPATITRISVYKGFLFVVVTSILLYHLVNRYLFEFSQLKDEIKNKDQLFNILSESMIDAYASIDMTGKFLQFNEAYRTILGYETEELLSKTCLDLTPEKWHLMQRKIMEEQVIPTGHSDIFEKEYRRKDGTVFPVEIRLQLIYDDEGNPYVMWAIVHDITERKRIQDNLAYKSLQLEELNHSLEKRVENAILELRQRDQVLLQQNRLAIMGDMINNIAHQWRQPLNTLGLHIQLLPSELIQGGINKEYLDKYVKDSLLIIDHMSKTIDDFSCFFKPDKEKGIFNVNHSVDRAIQLIKASYDYNHIKVVVKCMDEPVIHGYSNEYSQVILNILCNAKDALLTSKTDNPQVIITTKVEDGRSVVTISDNAGGIPDEILYKVFDPFFSTKGAHGTGIGLSMSKYIIERNMNGLLNVYNNGIGAEFRIVV
jgi:PAS domain S-box-containing protein